jgi:hypothetical protein
MRFLKMTVVTATRVGVAAVVDGNVVEKNGIWHPGEAGGMALVLDCTRSSAEDHLDRMAARPAASYPTHV